MKEPKYFFPNYDRAVLHVGITPTNGPELTLKGVYQQLLDQIHVIMANHAGLNAQPLDGALAQQINRGYIKGDIFDLADRYPRLYRDAVAPGQTAEGLAWYFWHQAEQLFKFYGR